MQHASNSPWRTSTADPPKPQYSLSHTISMVNLHEEPTWYNRGPSSPTSSSVSTSTSRSATPTTTNNNPWSNVMTSPISLASSKSPDPSPKHSPTRTPPYTSRSTTPTPIAPQPLRPFQPMAGFVPMSPPASVVGDSYQSDFPSPMTPAFPGSPNPYRQPVAPVSPLIHGFINTLALSSQGQSLSGWFYDLCRKQGWDAVQIKRIWQWTLSNPRLAILLYVCDDVASWRQASFFDLRDESLPFPEDRLQGIVADARRVVEEQWRATSKEMQLNGSHVDFVARETVPLQPEGVIRTSKNSEKSLDRVRLLGNTDERILVRKRFVTTRPSQKAALIEQINRFKSLEHKSIAKLLCSYAQPSHIGIVMEKARCSLDDFLAMPGSDPSRSRLLVDWMHDLASALEYLHSHSICHRSIRPRKILISNSHVLLAPFDIGTNITFNPTTQSSQRLDHLSTHIPDQPHIYAAPEALLSRAKRPADVFSLGCVFLSMLTVAQNQSLHAFTQYRAGSTHDPSFHAHLDRVASWRNRLVASTTASLRAGIGGSGRRMRQLRAEAEWLGIVEKMVAPRPKERVKMGQIVASVGAGKGAGRRRSLDGGGGALVDCETMPPQVLKTRAANPQLRRPELSVFDGYFQQQARKLEPAGGW